MMRTTIVLAVALLAGCASSPEYVASRSNWDVCRLSMGGPHAQNADIEAQRRGLDCRPYYGAIQQQLANERAAVQQFQQANQPALVCKTIPWGTGTRTSCN